VLAEGLLDRLLNSAHTLTLLGRSYGRRQRARPGDDRHARAVTGEEVRMKVYLIRHVQSRTTCSTPPRASAPASTTP
jgi:hypothetical protein